MQRSNLLHYFSVNLYIYIYSYIIQQFFEKKYSLAEKYMILSVLSTGARELAGLQVKKVI